MGGLNLEVFKVNFGPGTGASFAFEFPSNAASSLLATLKANFSDA